MQNQILGFFIITTIAFAGLSAVQWKRAANFRRQAESLRHEAFEEAHRAGMQEAEVRSLERRLLQRDEDTAALTEMVQELMDSTNQLSQSLAASQSRLLAASTDSPHPTNNGSTHALGMLGKAMEDPAMQKMIRAQQKMMMDTMYGPLFQELRLSEEQTKALKELLLDSQMSNVKLGTTAMSGDEGERLAAAEEIKRQKQVADEEIKALLGEEGFAVYQDYQVTMGERVMLNQFKSQLEGSANSLQGDQYSLLVEAALDEKRQAPPGFGDQTEDPVKAMEMLQSQGLQETHLARQEETNRRVLQRAQNFLSPEQLSSLEEFMGNQMEMMRLGLKMSQAMTGAPAVSDASSPISVE